MISADHLHKIAFWSHDLDDKEIERVRRAIVERQYTRGDYICHRGDRLESWTGVSDGLIKLGTTSRSGKTVTLAGIRSGAWFGEGTLLKDEVRHYDLVALRDTRLALMNKATFFWLFERSAAFNRFLVRQFNERLGQFIALVEYDRSLGATARVARSIAWLFNPVLYRGNEERHLDISHEEIGLLSGLSRPVTGQSLKRLEDEGLLRMEHGGLTVLDLSRLRVYGE